MGRSEKPADQFQGSQWKLFVPKLCSCVHALGIKCNPSTVFLGTQHGGMSSSSCSQYDRPAQKYRVEFARWAKNSDRLCRAESSAVFKRVQLKQTAACLSKGRNLSRVKGQGKSNQMSCAFYRSTSDSSDSHSLHVIDGSAQMIFSVPRSTALHRFEADLRLMAGLVGILWAITGQREGLRVCKKTRFVSIQRFACMSSGCCSMPSPGEQFLWLTGLSMCNAADGDGVEAGW